MTDCNYFRLFVLPAGGIWVKSFQIDQSALLKTFLSSTRGKTKSFAMSIWCSFFKLFGLFQSTKDINALRLAWPNLLMLLTCWPYLADLAWSKWKASVLWRFDLITNKWQRRILHIFLLEYGLKITSVIFKALKYQRMRKQRNVGNCLRSFNKACSSLMGH